MTLPPSVSRRSCRTAAIVPTALLAAAMLLGPGCRREQADTDAPPAPAPAPAPASAPAARRPAGLRPRAAQGGHRAAAVAAAEQRGMHEQRPGLVQRDAAPPAIGKGCHLLVPGEDRL